LVQIVEYSYQIVDRNARLFAQYSTPYARLFAQYSTRLNV